MAEAGVAVKQAFDKTNLVTFTKHLRAHVSAKEFGEGACAKHVREALFAGSMKLHTWPAPAKDWGPSMLALGFVAQLPETYKAKLGDVAVIEAPSSATRKDGHMQGYDGANWISDFVQTGFWPGPAYRKDKPKYVVYRLLVPE